MIRWCDNWCDNLTMLIIKIIIIKVIKMIKMIKMMKMMKVIKNRWKIRRIIRYFDVWSVKFFIALSIIYEKKCISSH